MLFLFVLVAAVAAGIGALVNISRGESSGENTGNFLVAFGWLALVAFLLWVTGY